MNEIATCPVCGQELAHLEPLEYDTREFFDCLNFDCFFRCSVTDLPRIAAAMELAKAETKMTKAIEDGAAFDCARVDLFEAKRRVLEVFNAK